MGFFQAFRRPGNPGERNRLRALRVRKTVRPRERIRPPARNPYEKFGRCDTRIAAGIRRKPRRNPLLQRRRRIRRKSDADFRRHHVRILLNPHVQKREKRAGGGGIVAPRQNSRGNRRSVSRAGTGKGNRQRKRERAARIGTAENAAIRRRRNGGKNRLRKFPPVLFHSRGND